jgi:Domain of unknown function (DUF4351)
MSPESTLRSLLANCFPDFLAMYVPDCAARLAPSSLSAVEDAESPEALIFLATVDAQEIIFCLHLMAPGQTPEELDALLLEDSLYLYNKHRRPVFPIALAIAVGPRSAQPGQVRITIGQTVVLDFRYQMVDLANASLGDFGQHQNPLSIVLMARAGVDQPDRPRFKLDCLNVLAGMKLDPKNQILASGFIDQSLPLDPAQEAAFAQYLNAANPEQRQAVQLVINLWAEEGYKIGFAAGQQNAVEAGKAQGFPAGHAKGFESGFAEGIKIGETQAYEAALQKGKAEGQARGIEQGERQGNQQGFSKGFQRGRQDAGLRVMTATLRRRFGNVPAQTIAKMSAISADCLEDLADDFWTITDLQDLQSWLRDHTL